VTASLNFDDLIFDIFDAGDPQCHFITTLRRTGRFPRVHCHLGAKLISSFMTSTRDIKRQKGHNIRPHCQESTSDCAKHSLSLSNVAILHICSCSGRNARPLLHKRAFSNAFPWYPLLSQTLLCKWRVRFVHWYTLGSYCHEMRKIEQTHRASVVADVTKDRA